MFNIVTNSTDETKKIGIGLGKLLAGGDIVCLMGDLGAGKTTLSQSIAKGLDVDDYVTSPTFTLINEYQGRYPVYHFDVYRIEEAEEMYELGYEEYFYSDGVTIIEWANLIEEILPRERLNIRIKRGKGDSQREMTLYGEGKRYEEIIKSLQGSIDHG